jgi:hypothetical protein
MKLFIYGEYLNGHRIEYYWLPWPPLYEVRVHRRSIYLMGRFLTTLRDAKVVARITVRELGKSSSWRKIKIILQQAFGES